MKKLSLILLFCLSATSVFAGKPKTVRVSVEPAEIMQSAKIFVDGSFMGYGVAEFTRPRKNEVRVIHIEAPEYVPVTTKYYGTDKRSSISFRLLSDGYYRSSAASGIVNKFFTIDIDSMYYTIDGKSIDVRPAWRLLHQILLNYFDEISMTDMYSGYMQTPWQYKTFPMSDKQIRNRVTIRDISTPDRVAFQIKIESETAGAAAAKHGEFTSVDRIPKEFQPIIQELQTRIGKVRNL